MSSDLDVRFRMHERDTGDDEPPALVRGMLGVSERCVPPSAGRGGPGADGGAGRGL
jgi:hypothetical protein